MMTQWTLGDIEECWREELRMEQVRKSHNRSRRRGQKPAEKNGATYTITEERRKRDSAKLLTNIGEYRKAMSALLSNGTATITDTVVDQLRRKHPPRTKPSTRSRPPYAESEDWDRNDDDEWDMLLPPPPADSNCRPSPTQATGANHPKSRNDDQGRSQSTNMDIDPVNSTTDPGRTKTTDRGREMIPEEEVQTVRGTPGMFDSQSNHEPGSGPEIEAPLNFPSLSVTAEDIRKAVKDVRRLTSGGL